MRHVVVLSSYNRPNMVANAIASVRTQRGAADFRLIVADDASDAETRSSIERAFDGDRRCELLVSSVPREGVGAVTDPTIRAVSCINAAIAKSDGDLYHYLPDDDWFNEWRFQSFETWFRDAPPSLLVAYGRMIYVDQDGMHVGSLYNGQILTSPACNVDHGQIAHRRSVFDQVPLWPSAPNNFCFDASFFNAIVEHGHAFYPVNAVVNYKRQHKLSLQRLSIDNSDVAGTQRRE